MRELAQRFVPVADEVWKLQRGRDAEARFFQAFADRAHYRAEGGSRQGIYVITPAGQLLASANELDAQRLKALLREGLAAWEALGDDERERDPGLEANLDNRWEGSCPSDGLVLVETLRDVPSDFAPGAAPLLPSNRDHVWLSRSEARDLAETEAGAQRFVERLARLHLVDAVRGQSLPFALEELERAEIRVDREPGPGPGETRLRVVASTSARAQGPWLMGDNSWKPEGSFPRSVEVELAGHALWNDRLGAFTEFELVGIGERTGKTQVNGRYDDEGPAPIGFHFRLATDGVRIPPAFVSVYDAPWIVAPTE